MYRREAIGTKKYLRFVVRMWLIKSETIQYVNSKLGSLYIIMLVMMIVLV